jgi:uncharacterized protein YbaA (DUF1428 family)
MSKSNSTEASIASHIVYRVPKNNHDAMLQICKEAYDMFKQHGILHYDAFKLSNTDVPMEGFENVASIVSAIKMRKYGLSQFTIEIVST